MGPTSKLLRRHLRRRRDLPFPPPLSHSFPDQNPNQPSPPPSPFRVLFNRHRPTRTLNPSNFSPARSFSWIPWIRSPKPAAGSEDAAGGPETGSELSSVDGSETGAEESSGLRFDSSGVFENDRPKSSGDGSGLSLVTGSDNGTEVLNLDQPWYSPFQDSLMWMMDNVHDLTGLPWWLVISGSTLAFRVSLFPVLVFQLKKMQRVAELMPKLPPPLPPPLSGRTFREQYLLFQKKRREIGCPSYLWSFTFFIVQFPCFLLGMTTIRRMCLDHHAGFDVGGTLWFQNLTDFPHGLLGPTFPVLIAGLHYVNVQISFQNFKDAALPGVLGLLAKYYKLYLDILAIPLLAIGFYIPQGSLVYWVTNSSLTLIQLLSLKNPYIRNKLGLAPEKILKMRKPRENVMLENRDTLQPEVLAETVSPEKLLDVSLEYLATGHQDKALPLLRVAIERDPELVRALVAMGQILCSKESFEEAADYFERAISKIQHEEENSLLVLAFFGAGVSRIWQGRKPEGIQHLKRIAELKVPDSPMDKACYYKGLVMLGSALFGDGEKSEAAKYLRIAAAYDPGVNAYLKECEEGQRR